MWLLLTTHCEPRATSEGPQGCLDPCEDHRGSSPSSGRLAKEGNDSVVTGHQAELRELSLIGAWGGPPLFPYSL